MPGRITQLNTQIRQEQTAEIDEERELLQLRLKLSAKFGAPPRLMHHVVQYLTRADLLECLEYASGNDLAAIRDVFKEVREREYPKRAAEDIAKYGHLYHPKEEAA